MICQKCGCQNADNEVFCRKCGALIEDEGLDQWFDSVMPEQKQFDFNALIKMLKPKKKVKNWVIILAGEVLLSVVLLFSLFQKVTGRFSAEHTAEHYFVALVNGEWEEAYSMLELEEGEFTSRKAYDICCENNSLPFITSYSIQKENQVGTLGQDVTVLYRERGTSSDTAYHISLNKQLEKKYIFFENWKVSAGSLLSKDIPVTVPHGAAVSIDGIPLGDTYLSAVENSLDFYSIPVMFAGKHQIVVSMQEMETVKEVFDTNLNGYSLDKMQISPNILQKLLGQAEKDLQSIYTAAIQGTPFNKISELFVADGEKAAEIESSYISLSKELADIEYHQIEALDLTSVAGEAYASPEDEICAEVDVSFSYRIAYSYLDSWEEVRKKDTCDGEDELTFYYVPENGKWSLGNLGCHSLYY